MNGPTRTLLAAAAVLAAPACTPSAPPPAAPAPTEPVVERPTPGRLEVVGRGPVTSTRTTDLWVFEGVNGRDYAYTGTFGACPECEGNKLYVWDVTDPAAPVRTDSVLVDARIVNDVVVNPARTVAAITREGSESRRDGVVLLDISDPAHPTILSDYWETITGGARNLSFGDDGRYLYVVNAGTNDLAVLDVSDPRDPRQVGSWGLPASPIKYLGDVTVKDGMAYLAYWDDGLIILDVGAGIKEGTPQSPKFVGQFRYRTEWRGQQYGRTHFAFPYTNAAGKQYVFVGDEIIPPGVDLTKPFPTGGILHVIDVSQPTEPLEVATYEAPGAGVHNFWVENDRLYMGAYGAGMRVLDVSGELRGSLRDRELAVLRTADEQAFLEDAPAAWAAMPHEGLVYGSDFNSGLWIARLVL